MRALAAASGLDEEEAGWKFVHGDVFRFPPHTNLFCAFIGTGTQVRPPAWTWVCVYVCTSVHVNVCALIGMRMCAWAQEQQQP